MKLTRQTQRAARQQREARALADRVCETFITVLPDGRRVIFRVHAEQPIPFFEHSEPPQLRAATAGEFHFALHALSPRAEALTS